MREKNLTVEEMREKLRNRKFDKNQEYAFVSYSSNDSEKVYKCVLQLVEAGANIWIDVELQKHVGEKWNDEALKAINRYKCKKLLFFISETSMISAPVAAEIYFARNIKCKADIVPIMTVDVKGSLSTWFREELDISQAVTEVEEKCILEAYEKLLVKDSDKKPSLLGERERIVELIETYAFVDGNVESTLRAVDLGVETLIANLQVVMNQGIESVISEEAKVEEEKENKGFWERSDNDTDVREWEGEQYKYDSKNGVWIGVTKGRSEGSVLYSPTKSGTELNWAGEKIKIGTEFKWVGEQIWEEVGNPNCVLTVRGVDKTATKIEDFELFLYLYNEEDENWYEYNKNGFEGAEYRWLENFESCQQMDKVSGVWSFELDEDYE